MQKSNIIVVFRKRLRVVCSEELPWRSQANLIMATCHLDMLLGRLGVSHVTTEMEPHLQRPDGVTFDKAGVIIDGVLPIHPPVIPGARGNKKVHIHIHVQLVIKEIERVDT